MSAKEMGARIKAATSDAVKESQKTVLRNAKEIKVIDVKQVEKQAAGVERAIDVLTNQIEAKLQSLSSYKVINGAYQHELAALVGLENALDKKKQAERELKSWTNAPLGGG